MHRLVWLGILCLACGCAAAAQEGDAKAPKKDPPPEQAPKKERVKDPTDMSDRLKEALKPEEKAAAAAPAPRLPEIQLKAYVQAADKAPSAIIEVKGKGMVTVRSGSQISISGEGGGSLTLTVKSVAEGSVIIEVPGSKEPLIVK